MAIMSIAIITTGLAIIMRTALWITMAMTTIIRPTRMPTIRSGRYH
jgi:hypothetical protein